MPKYGGSLLRAMEDNQRRKCKLSSCQNRRWRVSGYCVKHDAAFKNWGHPCGRSIKDRELVDEFDAVSAIIDKNRDHKGILTGVRFFEQWMVQASYSHDRRTSLVPAAYHLARLHDAQVNSLDLLKVVASVWLFSTRYSRSVVFNDAYCRALMGHKVLKFIPISQKKEKQRYPTGKERKDAGKYIQDNIGVLLVNITDAVNKQEQRQQSRLINMNGELDLPSAS